MPRDAWGLGVWGLLETPGRSRRARNDLPGGLLWRDGGATDGTRCGGQGDPAPSNRNGGEPVENLTENEDLTGLKQEK